MLSLRNTLNLASLVVVFGAAAFGSRPASAALAPVAPSPTACCAQPDSSCYGVNEDGTFWISPGRAC